VKKIYLIAGEVSGDKIGAALISSLKSLYGREAQFFGVGGPLIEKEGVKSLFPNSIISLMGFFEILPHIFKLKKLIKDTAEDIFKIQPDIVITIDSPGFNFRVAEILRKSNPKFKIVHYVAPSVWAYKEKRAVKCAYLYDHMFALFPFELPYFQKVGLDITCVGHPIFDYDYDRLRSTSFRLKHKIEASTKLICITPGSRKGEIKRHMLILLKVIEKLTKDFEGLTIGIPAPSLEIANFIKSIIGSTDRKIIIVLTDEDKLNLYKAADLALAKSGTNTLEISACGTAQIVFYKLNILTWYALRLMIKVKFASIINIIANREIIPELLQSNFTVESLYKKASEYLKDKKKIEAQVNDAQKTLEIIGFRRKENSSEIAARTVKEILDKEGQN
jgi:lipid-A-disaccharide synthase